MPAGGFPLVGVVNPVGPDGPVVAGGLVGPCEMRYPSSYKSLDPLEHSVLDYAGPDGRHVAVGPLGTLSSSDCHPAGPYVARGPVGTDDSFKVLEPLEHSVLDHAGPAGQHATVGPVGPFGTLSPSDLSPCWPGWPICYRGPCWPR